MSLYSLQTISQVLILVGGIIVVLGSFGQYYFGHQIERERQNAELHDKQQAAAASASAAEQFRRQEILKQLREYYIMLQDGVSSEMFAGVAPLPKEWVEQQLQQRKETWRQDEYY